MRPVTRLWRCETCDKPTTRMYGVLATVKRPEGVTSGRSVVLGYCAEHRAEVVPAFLATLEDEGAVRLISDPPEELRPAHADAFLSAATAALTAATGAVGDLDAVIPAFTPDDVPQDCPHCQGRLSWGTGPHVRDAADREGTTAWECLDCRSAGMLGPLGA